MSFFRFNDDYDNNDIFPRFTFHTSAGIKTGAYTQFIPRIVFNSQGPFMDLEFGSNLKFTTFSKDNLNFHLGLSAHVVRDLETVGISSVVPFVGLQLDNILIGASYDVGVNTLINNKRNFSTLEFSISYLGEYDNQPIFCPKF